MTAPTHHAIVEGEPGIFPAPVAQVLRALGRLVTRRRRESEAPAPPPAPPPPEDPA